jgi:hypothetical protein
MDVAAHHRVGESLCGHQDSNGHVSQRDETGKAEVSIWELHQRRARQADKVKYNVADEIAWCLNIGGTLAVEMQSRPGLLTTTDLFCFQAKWVEQNHDRCYFHDGFVTDCKMPDSWWRFHRTAQAEHDTGCRRFVVEYRRCAIGGCNDNVGPFRTLERPERVF